MKKIVDCFKMISKSSVRAFIMTLLIFLPLFIIAVWAFKDSYEHFSDTLLRLICMVTYFISFNSVREKERYILFSSNEKFNFVDEGKSYFLKEEKYILVIYAVMATLGEIYSFITPNNTKNPIAFLCSWCLPFYSAINVPILRSIISVLLSGIIHLIIVELNSYKISKKQS